MYYKETIKPEFLIKSIILSEKSLILQFVGKRLHFVFYWIIIGWYKAFCNNKNLEVLESKDLEYL